MIFQRKESVMNLKRSVRKSTRTAVSCGAAVDIMPIVMDGARRPVSTTEAAQGKSATR
jgi:hypothetical protein